MEMQQIQNAPKTGETILVWSEKEPRVMRFAKWGTPWNFKKAEPCWITISRNAISNLPTHWIVAPDVPANTLIRGASHEPK